MISTKDFYIAPHSNYTIGRTGSAQEVNIDNLRAKSLEEFPLDFRKLYRVKVVTVGGRVLSGKSKVSYDDAIENAINIVAAKKASDTRVIRKNHFTKSISAATVRAQLR